MDRVLEGCKLLLLEDEPLVMMDVCAALEERGATVYCAQSLKQAETLIAEADVAAAVLDYVLREGTADQICERLKYNGIPFAIYSGYRNVEGTCARGDIIEKPSTAEELISHVVSLLSSQGIGPSKSQVAGSS
jgi:DNA-binding response OmpR family regulator